MTPIRQYIEQLTSQLNTPEKYREAISDWCDQDEYTIFPNLEPWRVQIVFSEALKRAKNKVFIYTDNPLRNLLTDEVFNALKNKHQQSWAEIHIFTLDKNIPSELMPRFNEIKELSSTFRTFSEGIENPHEVFLFDNRLVHFEVTNSNGQRCGYTTTEVPVVKRAQTFFENLNEVFNTVTRHRGGNVIRSDERFHTR